MKKREGFVSNSSSSCFVCDTDKTVEQIEEELRDMLYHFKEMMGEKYFHYGSNYDDIFGSVSFCDEKYYNEMLSYYGVSKDIIGKVIINSASDNTIPYTMHDLIEEKFDAYRIHLS